MVSKRLTISNVITISRLVMLPFIVIFLINQKPRVAFIIMLISFLSDAVDGYLARKLHQESELGKLLDPLCDKISLAVILVTLLVINSIPVWIVIIVVARDFLILLGSLIILRRRALVFKSNLFGKITGFLFGALILSFTINLKQLGTVLLYITIPMMIVTFITYVNRYFRVFDFQSNTLEGEE
jgi:cardiolipin synthase